MSTVNESYEERLNLLQEEGGEIVQAASKILRFGPNSYHPRNPGPSNREHLEEEIGGFCAILTLLAKAGEISEEECAKHELAKLRSIEKYTKYQKYEEE